MSVTNTVKKNKCEVPLLFIDACSLLDLVRSINRKDVDDKAILDDSNKILGLLKNEKLKLLVPEQVEIEVNRNLDRINDEFKKRLVAHWQQSRKIEELIKAYGLMSHTNIPDSTASLLDEAGNLSDIRNDQLLDWQGYAECILTKPEVSLKAIDRLNKRKSPSSEAKSEFPDCLIIETVFDEISTRRANGMSMKSIFLSSNKSDYWDKNLNCLKAPLDQEFASHGLKYAFTYGYAYHLLTS